MSPSKLSESILKKISQKKINPRPKWYFCLKNTTFWIIFILSIVLGSLGFGIILTIISAIGIEDVFDVPVSPVTFLIRAIPILWVSFFLVFLCTALWGFHHTKKGYKIPLKNLLITNITVSIFIGIGLHSTDIANRTERRIAQAVNFYDGIEKKQGKLWTRPSEGIIVGIVLEINNKYSWTVRTRNGIMDISLKKNTQMPPDIKIGSIFRIIGEQKRIDLFEAHKVLPWKKRR